MNPLKKELKSTDFRVAIFGSARIKKGDKMYKQVYRLAKAIGEMKMDVVTGGGPGLMEAASKGHEDGSPKNDSHTLGLAIRLPKEQKPNEYLDIVNSHSKFSTRLDEFMKLSNVIVVTPGGIGTSLELFFAWQLMQVGHICKMPIILMGGMWKELLKWIKKWILKHELMNREDLDFIVYVKDEKEAMRIVKKAKKAFDENGSGACINWKKYRLKEK